MRYLDDPALPIDNNHDEQQIRPWATGRKNWLFAGTLLAGQRAAAITSLIQSAKLNGHDPYAYLKDVLERLPTQRASAASTSCCRIAGQQLPTELSATACAGYGQHVLAGRLPCSTSPRHTKKPRMNVAFFLRTPAC